VVDYRIYVFGGKGAGGILYNDLWCLNVETWTWELVPSASAAPPSPRFGHTMIAVANKLVVFGGWDGKVCNSETWLFDVATLTWVRPPVSGIPPSARHGHSAVLDDVAGRMVVFAGWHPGADGVPEYQRDVRELNLRTLAWVRTRVGGEYPTPRYGHSCTCVGNVMVVSGGWDGPRDEAAPSMPDAGTITIPYASGMGGDALAGPGSFITVRQARSVSSATRATPNPPILPSRASPSMRQVPFSRHVDTFFYDLETDEWVQPTIAGKAPGYRYGSTAVTTAAQVLVWGGWESGRSLNEFVVLDLTGLTGGGGAPVSSGGSGEDGGGEGSGGAGHE